MFESSLARAYSHRQRLRSGLANAAPPGSIVLIHADGADASTSFSDVYGHAVTAGGTARISTSVSKFGTASISCAVSPYGYLSVAHSAEFDFGSSDWCIEGWFYMVSAGTTTGLVSKRSSTGNTAMFNIVAFGGTLYAFVSPAGATWQQLIGGTLTSNTWFHVALVRKGNVFSLYQDGVLKNSYTCTAGAAMALTNSSNICFGAGSTASEWLLNGYMEELRISLGDAIYSAAFTPPSARFER